MNSSKLRVAGCLSLSGRFASFGEEVGAGLKRWAEWHGGVELAIEDDRSDLRELEQRLPGLLESCDVALGPYSTRLMRRAAEIARESGGLIWNHGGAGDDVQAGHPGHVASVLTPASRYATPFVEHLTSEGEPRKLWIAEGKGSFARQVAEGARKAAHARGIDVGEGLAETEEDAWSLFSAGTFEDDIATVKRALALPNPPRAMCAVAAGVHRFGQEVENPRGIFGVGQWLSGQKRKVDLGPQETDVLGNAADYPVVQAVAAAVLGVHCVERAGSTAREAVWEAATALDTSTLFGRFKIEPTTGVQVGHEPVLMRWGSEGLRSG